VKRFFKQIAIALATMAVAPLALPELLARRIAGRDVWFRAQTEVLSLVPGKIGIYFRGAYYHLMLPRCPLGCGFQFGTIINSEAEFGERVDSGPHVIIGIATIGDDCMISEGAHILSGKFSHGITDPTVPFNEQPAIEARIKVGPNCWIGANAIVMADVAENCVVGAGAVITRPFPGNKIIVGNPARAVANTFEPKLAEGRKANKNQ
jgi:virginiamycin A acetyltransferase